MAPNFPVTIWFIFFVLSVSYQTARGRRVSADGDVSELDEQLNILNKPVLEAVQDELGTLFDCIDIYKQPAFDHPLHKNHKIQMKPTSPVEGSSNEHPKIAMKYVNCPKGTVPIRRKTPRSTSIHPLTDNPGEYVAAVRRKDNASPKVRGAEGYMSVINPKVDDDQSSQALIRMGSGSNLIEAGWAVNPKLYGDNHTHFTVYWRDDKSGCYNLDCPGFVQINSSVPLGFGYAESECSTYKGTQWEIKISINQDPKTRNWWLSYNNIDLGYWPGFSFLDLVDGVNTVEFGGITRGPTTKPSPPMGFGTFPAKNFSLSGYFAQMQIFDENFKWVSLPKGDFSEHSDNLECYGVKLYDWEDNNGYSMEYGGPGGNC